MSSPDRADALIGAIILGQESQIDWKEAIVFQREIKHRMQFEYLRTGCGRPISTGADDRQRNTEHDYDG